MKQRSRWNNWIKRPGNRERLNKIYAYQRGNCYYCNRHVPYYPGQSVNYKTHGNHATFDHEVPLSKGGNLGMTNIVMACWECNQQRNQEDIDYKNYLESQKKPMLDPTLKMPTSDKIDIEENWKTLTRELMQIQDSSRFIPYLAQTDFKTAPASTKFHMNYPGGLCEHSLNVLRFLRETQNIMKVPNISPESIIKVALLHDLCKANYYKVGEVFDKEYKNQTNQWRMMEVWTVDDTIPLGHGEKSVMMALPFMNLTLEEMAAIRWHMAWSDQGVHSYYPSGAPFKTSLEKYPLLKLLMIADAQAELYESYAYATD